MKPRFVITSDKDVTLQLLKLQNLGSFANRLVTYATLMEKVENWTVDDLKLDSEGLPIGVDDDRGTGVQRLRLLQIIQECLTASETHAYWEAGRYEEHIDRKLVHLLGSVKTGRFLACGYYMERVSPKYVRHLMARIVEWAEDDVYAHVISNRLDRLHRLEVLQTIFSEETRQLVMSALQAVKRKEGA